MKVIYNAVTNVLTYTYNRMYVCTYFHYSMQITDVMRSSNASDGPKGGGIMNNVN